MDSNSNSLVHAKIRDQQTQKREIKGFTKNSKQNKEGQACMTAKVEWVTAIEIHDHINTNKFSW